MPQRPHRPLLIPIAILAGLFALAVDALHLDLGRIDFADKIAPLMDPNDERMRKSFTGIQAVDGFLTTLLIMFQPIFTGEMPELSLFAFYFAGQIVSVVTLLTVQGLRKGTRRNMIRFATLWAVLMQIIGYGVVMPIYCILDLLFSSSDMALVNPEKLHAIIPAFAFGFFIPSALQTLPTSRDMHQILLAIWQAFPIHVGLLHWGFSYLVKPRGSSKLAVNHAYSFAVRVGAITHWVTIALIVSAKVVPGLFPADVAEQLTFSNVFIPTALHWYGPKTIASAVFHFLQYDLYIGAVAGLVWAATHAHVAGIWECNLGGIGWILRDVLVLGLPSAVISLLWKRNAAVFGA
ncbi:hypothetical protein ACHAPT_013445 [Fusarium lateritium]